MEQLHAFLAGPAFIASLVVSAGGMILRLVLYFRGLDWRLDRVAYKPGLAMGLKGGLYSIFVWLMPFGTRGWRLHPFFTFCSFLFHAGLIVVPLFLLGHNEILRMRLGCSLSSMPQPVSDTLTVAALAAGGFLLLRRLVLPQVRLLSSWQDYGVLILSLSPLVTGFLNRLYGDTSEWWLICHIAAVDLLLLLAPFTRLSHVVLYFATRWQIGADYSIKRGGRNRGPYFPW